MTETIENRVARLEAAYKDQKRQMNHISEAVDDLTKRILQMGKVNWAALGTMTFIIVSAFTAIGAGFIVPLKDSQRQAVESFKESQENIAESLKWVNQRLYEHADGHPKRIEQMIDTVNNEIGKMNNEVLSLRNRLRVVETKESIR